MEYSAKITGFKNSSNCFIIEIIDKQFEQLCLMPKYKTLIRTQSELTKGNIIKVTELGIQNDNLLFQEIFEYKIGENLQLKFIKDYEKNGVLLRQLEDVFGRLITAKRENWQNGSNYKEPKAKQKIGYSISNIRNQRLYLNEIWNDENKYDNSHLSINDEIELIVVTDTKDDKYVSVIDEHGVITTIGNSGLLNKTDFKNGEKYLFKVVFFKDDGFPFYVFAGPSPHFLNYDDFDVPKSFFEKILEINYDKYEKLDNYKKLMMDYHKKGNMNWIINFNNLILPFIYDLFKREKFIELIEIGEHYEKFYYQVIKSEYSKSFNEEKIREINQKFGIRKKKIDGLIACSKKLKKQNNDEYVLELISYIFGKEKNVILFSEKFFEFMNIWRHIPHKLNVDRGLLKKTLGPEYFESINLHYNESLNEPKYLIPSLVIEQFYEEDKFFNSVLFSHAADLRKSLRLKLSIDSHGFIDMNRINSNLYEFKFYLLLEYLEFLSLEKSGDKPNALIQNAKVKRNQALTLQEKDSRIKVLDDALDILEHELPLKKYLDGEELKYWGRVKQKEHALILEIKASNIDDFERKLQLYKAATTYYQLAASKFNFFRCQSICHYYEILLMVDKNTNIEKIANTASMIISDYKKNQETINTTSIRGKVKKAIWDLIQTTSLIGKTDKADFDILYERSMKNTEKSIFLPDRQEYAKLVLSFNLLKGFLESEKILIDKIFTFLREGAVKIEQGNISEEQIEHPILSEIEHMENNKLELKGTWSMNANDWIYAGKCKFSDARKFDIYKAVAGMLNHNGGRVIIGVLELKEYPLKIVESKGYEIVGDNFLFGIEQEINNTKKKSYDDYINVINQMLRTVFKDDYCDNITLNVIKLKSCSLLEIVIKPYYDNFGGVWIHENNDPKLKEHYFKRHNNSTISMERSSALKYNMKRYREYNT